jgi:hypothetical protein
MAEALILEFDGVGIEDYERVNGILGIDMETGEGDWPEGLLVHSAASKPGGFVVYELWASQEDQQRFMDGRLGSALQEGGIEDPPTRLEWLNLAAHHDLGGR